MGGVSSVITDFAEVVANPGDVVNFSGFEIIYDTTISTLKDPIQLLDIGMFLNVGDMLMVNGIPLKETFGTRGKDWNWQYGGEVNIPANEVKLELKDLTGFEGRCDAIYFSKESSDNPPDSSKILGEWRRNKLGLPEKPESL